MVPARYILITLVKLFLFSAAVMSKFVWFVSKYLRNERQSHQPQLCFVIRVNLANVSTLTHETKMANVVNVTPA